MMQLLVSSSQSVAERERERERARTRVRVWVFFYPPSKIMLAIWEHVGYKQLELFITYTFACRASTCSLEHTIVPLCHLIFLYAV